MRAGGGQKKGRDAENDRVRYLKANGYSALRNPQYSQYGKLPDISADKTFLVPDKFIDVRNFKPKQVKINFEVKCWSELPTKELMKAYRQVYDVSKAGEVCVVAWRENRTQLKVKYQGKWFVFMLMDDLMELIG